MSLRSAHRDAAVVELAALGDLEPHLLSSLEERLVRLRTLPSTHRPFYHGVRRSLDVILSATALLVLGPLLILVALAIRITSRGPSLYSHYRVGEGGRTFRMWKFRTMHVGADSLHSALREELQRDLGANNLTYKNQFDPRVTTVGRILRQWSIDELPQLWNVLRGDMAIVGPRPPLPIEVSEYRDEHLTRLTVKPGLTCIWQVSGRSLVTFDEWMLMDMEYIRTQGLWTDLKLISRTFGAVISRRGAW